MQDLGGEARMWIVNGPEIAHAGHNLRILVSPTNMTVPGAAERLAQHLADILNDPEELDYTTTVGACGHPPKKPEGKGWKLLQTTLLEARQVQWTWERPQRVARLGG